MTMIKGADAKATSAGPRIRFRGIHHLALNTENMKATADFYVGILGMRLVHAMKVPPGVGTGPQNRGNPPFEEIRHYFFDMGNDSLLAFFEIPKGAKEQGDRNALGAMQHVSFATTPRNIQRIRDRLEAHDVSYLGPMEVLPGVFSIYFFDPNGIRLEVSCQPDDGENEIRIVDGVSQTRRQAMSELATLTGDREWIRRMTAELPD